MSKIEIYNEDCYQAIVTDPPYQIENLKGGGMAKEKHISNVMEQIGESKIDIGIDLNILPEFLRVLKKPNIYIWCNEKQIFEYLNFFVGTHKLNFKILTWRKTNAMPLCGGKYLNDKEFCLYFYKGIKLNTNYSSATTHYDLPINIKDKELYTHPTIKPLEIIKNLITNSTLSGGVVLDPFLGSGTTAVACKELDRDFIGFEINKEYYDIAIDRLNGISQQDRKIKEQGQLSLFGEDISC